MAVMRTCCGCLNTKSGTMTVLLLYTVGYIASIVWIGINLGNQDFESWYDDFLKEDDTDCTKGEHKDTWWCEAVQDTSSAVEASFIISLIIDIIFLVCALVAIFGVTRGSHWFIMPWIVIEFILLAILAICLTLSIILLSVYPPDDGDSSYVIAYGIVSAAFTAFLFYLWLCVVSHFQILREVAALGLSDLEHVKPFKNEDTDSVMYTEEYPTSYDDQPEDKEEVVDHDPVDDDPLNHEYDPVKEHRSRPNSSISSNAIAPEQPAEYQAPVDLEEN